MYERTIGTAQGRGWGGSVIWHLILNSLKERTTKFAPPFSPDPTLKELLRGWFFKPLIDSAEMGVYARTLLSLTAVFLSLYSKWLWGQNIVTRLHGLPSWAAIAMHFSLQLDFRSNERVF